MYSCVVYMYYTYKGLNSGEENTCVREITSGAVGILRRRRRRVMCA